MAQPTYNISIRPSAPEMPGDLAGEPMDVPQEAIPGGAPEEVAQAPVAGGASEIVVGEPLPADAASTGDVMVGEPLPPEKPIDYTRGSPFAVRVNMQRSDNPEEARALLESVYGAGNIGQDKKGEWWFKDEEGNKVAVHPTQAPSSFRELSKTLGPTLSGMPVGPLPPVETMAKVADFINSLAPKLSESVVAAAAPTAGSVLGGVAGAPLGPGGVMLGQGLGYSAGKSLDEMVKGLQGFFRKNPGQTAHAVAGPEAAMNMLMPGAAPSRAAVRKDFFGVTPQTASMAKEAMEEGARPPIGAVAPEASGFEFKRKLAADVSGGGKWMHHEQNTAWLEDQINKFLQSTGMSAHDARMIIDDAWRGASAVDGKAAAQSIVDAATHQHQMLQRVATKHQTDARGVTDAFENLLRNWSKNVPEMMGQDLGQTILQARQKFSGEMKNAYGAWSKAAGDNAVVPIDDAIVAARDIVKSSPPNAVPDFIAQLAKRELGERVTVAEAHDARTMANTIQRNMTENGRLDPTFQYHYWDAVEKAFDNGINKVALATPGDLGQALKAIDTDYAKGIVTFKNGIARSLINDIQRGQVPQPWQVAKDILEKGSLQDVQNVKRYLKPEQQEQVAKAFVDNLLRASSSQADDQSAKLVLNPNTLLRNLEQYDDVMKQFMSPKFRGELHEFANSLRAVDGKLDPDFLRAGPLRQKIAEWREADRQLDAFVTSNPLKAFRAGDAAAKDKALNFIATPGNRAQVVDVMKQLSPAERQEVQMYVVSRLFGDVMETTPELNKKVTGDAIKNWLGRYTTEQLDVLLPRGLANDLSRLGDKINFLFKGSAPEELQSIGMTSANVKNKSFLNPNALRKRIAWYTTTLAVHQPGVLSWFADIAERDPTAARLVGSMLARWMANQATSGPGQGKPRPETLQ